MKKIFKHVYWATHFDDLPLHEQGRYLYEYVIYGNYIPVKRTLIFGINLFGNGFGPYKTYIEAKQICDFFNKEN